MIFRMRVNKRGLVCELWIVLLCVSLRIEDNDYYVFRFRLFRFCSVDSGAVNFIILSERLNCLT